jgi:hypothetical protein
MKKGRKEESKEARTTEIDKTAVHSCYLLTITSEPSAKLCLKVS